MRFLLIERLDNFSLKLLFQVEMTKKNWTKVILLFSSVLIVKNNNNNNYYYYYNKANNTSQKCFLDNNDTSQFYFLNNSHQTTYVCQVYWLYFAFGTLQLCSIRCSEQSGQSCTKGLFGLVKKMKYFSTGQ